MTDFTQICNRQKNRKMNSPIAKILALSTIGFLSGCALVDEIGDRAVTYNRQSLEAQNAGLFLNIVRASFRQPMQFTAITSVAGTSGASSTFSLSLPFGADAKRAYSASPGVGISAGETFTVNILDTQEFINGILAPIPIKTIDYYLQQQFPKAILLYLLIEKINIIDDKGNLIETVDNYPAGDNFPRFKNLIKELRDEGLTTESIISYEDIGPPLAAVDLKNPESMLKIDAAGFVLKPLDNNRFQLRKKIESIRFCFLTLQSNTPAGSKCGAQAKDRGEKISVLPPNISNEPRAYGITAGPFINGVAKPTTAGAPARGQPPSGTRSYIIYPRSTEGVIYYLGELMRLQIGEKPQPPITVPIGPDNNEENLFVARRGAGTNPFVRVIYRSETYEIPADEIRSTQIIALVSQLISLNKSSKDQPRTNVLTIVGP